MREPDFRALKETLLRGGIAPKHVRRTIAELKDHHTDLFGEALSRGCAFEDAEREASMRLGDEDSIAAEVLARPELKSWTHRWPWLAYCVTPTCVLIVAFVAVLLSLGLPEALRVDEHTFTGRWGAPDAVWSVSGLLRRYLSFALPLLVTGSSCLVAAQRRVALRWPAIGVVVASLVGAAIQFNVTWPSGPEAKGALAIAISVPPLPGSGGTMLRAAITSALTLGPLLLWRRRRAQA